jgi:hypothetical protein
MCKIRRGSPVGKMKYCCQRFAESVDEGKIIRSATNDETEWYMPESSHIFLSILRVKYKRPRLWKLR